MTTRFTLNGPPVGKQRTATFRGRQITPKKTRDAEKRIAEIYRKIKGKLYTGLVKLSVLVIIEMPKSYGDSLHKVLEDGRIWHMNRSAPDLDNIIKLVSDGLNGLAYKDDAQVAVITAGKRYGKPERTVVTVEQLDQHMGVVLPAQDKIENEIAKGAVFK